LSTRVISSTVIVLESTVVVVPLTVKLPWITVFPETSKVPKPREEKEEWVCEIAE
jgi:hypothetical protein